MALSSSTLANLIDSNLQNLGANGSNRTAFCQAVAKGIIDSIVGKQFTTVDTGQVSGIGTGIGLGIQNLDSNNMTTSSLSFMPSTGVNAEPLFQAINEAVVSHLATQATLTTTHNPVFSGTGLVVVGSITVTASEMSNNIAAELTLAGANGSNKSVLSNAIAQGIVSNIISNGTGLVTITGSPIGIPAPGSGVGVGVIS